MSPNTARKLGTAETTEAERVALEQWPEDMRSHPAVLAMVRAPEDTSGETMPPEVDRRIEDILSGRDLGIAPEDVHRARER
ncbi:MAG TPA: hypothetical protein PK141_24745 [Polyangiaceae bacterium]|nr:hypothetical protein [Polyangiaceae bacterium]